MLFAFWLRSQGANPTLRRAAHNIALAVPCPKLAGKCRRAALIPRPSHRSRASIKKTQVSFGTLMLHAPLLSLAAAAASVVAVAVPSSLQSSRALVTGQDEWHITTKNVSYELSHDTHLEYVSLVNCHGLASAGVNYPVLVHLPSSTTFWGEREASRRCC